MSADIGFFGLFGLIIIGVFGALGYALYTEHEQNMKQQEIRYMIVKDSLERLDTCQ